MKLDCDCVRDVLLYIEREQTMSKEDKNFVLDYLYCDRFFEGIKKHSQETIVYTVMKLKEAEYIKAYISEADDNILEFYVLGITYKGHQFIEKIKDDTVWGKTKSVAKSIGSFSFDIIGEIAGQVLSSLISQHFGLTSG